MLAAALAVLLLLGTGTEWVIKARASRALASNSISALAPDDTNISTPNRPGGDGSPPGSGAQGQNPAGSGTYEAENILLLGSDTRASAADAAIGGANDAPGGSDVVMVMHLSADRSHVTVVSIPRDMYVKAPTCKAWDHQTDKQSDKDYVTPYSVWRINSAFAVGGPPCTVRAVQQLSGLRIDRVIVIDFAGFQSMVDAIGGITVDACRPIVDRQLGTVLPRPGLQHIDGAQALSLVRARKVEGDSESDLARIRRQQKVLSTMLRQVTSAGVLLNPITLDSVLQAFVHTVQTDNVTLDDLLDIAQSLGNLSPSRVTFYTLPTVPAGNGVALDMAPAGHLIWDALVNDKPLPGETTTPAAAPSAVSPTPGAAESSHPPASDPLTMTSVVTSTPTAPQLLSVAPGDVDLQVVNVAGRSGVATAAMNALRPLGFQLANSDLLLVPGDVRDGLAVEYSPGNRDAAVTVAAAVPGAVLTPTDGLGDKVRLLLGSSFDGTVRGVSVGDPVPAALSTTRSPLLSTVTSTVGVAPPGGDAGSEAPQDAGGSPDASSTAPSTALQSTEMTSVNAGSASCI